MTHRTVGIVACLMIGLLFGCATGQTKPPNVVIILADDLGYGDVQAMHAESTIATPHLNRLAAQGVVFTDAHTPSSVCTPTRYGLLTGRYCWRTRLKSGVLFYPRDLPLIEPGQLTIGRMMQERGYHTACIGKWHLGVEWRPGPDGKPDPSQPQVYGTNDTGFDYSYTVNGSLDMAPYAYFEDGRATAPFTRDYEGDPFPHYMRKGRMAEGFDPARALDHLTEQATGYIRARARKGRPFFLYFPLTAPHKPVWPAERFEGRSGLGLYADFVMQVDWTVGQVLEALDASGAAENTLVIVTSDNGSFMYRKPAGTADHTTDARLQHYAEDRHRANGPWRGTKADIWEAGHRVPFIVRWPGRVEAGSRSAQTVCLTDVLATLAEVTGYELPDDGAIDSYSFGAALAGQADTTRPAVIHHSANGMFAVREGNWKLVLGNGSGGREKPRGKPFAKPYRLYDLAADPAEQHDVAADHPRVVARLTASAEAIRQADRRYDGPR